MTNSDAFTHIHTRRANHTRQTLQVLRRQLDALDADLDAMLSARRIDQLAPGTGLAGGARGTDHADPTGNTALRHDRAAEGWARWDEALAFLSTSGNTIDAWRRRQLGHNATPTGLCRDGACPDGKIADRGRIMQGVARCHACYQFWIRDASDPRDRGEREYRGQSPRRIGLGSEVA